jgi:NAD(P)-dependent dehydrogenase (short-subunit alcohol dehydrogenase family)
MKKTVLITGTSTGIGRAAVEEFSKQGWNVAATMRRPSEGKDMEQWPNVKLFALDVTDIASIQQAIQDTIRTFGDIHAVVNNAGYGAIGIFEAATPEQIKKQFDTNVFGVMNVIREILPVFRAKRSGTIINITSMGGLITFPIYSVYHGTKWAVEGFAESLAYELRPLGIRVKNVEPGAIKTDFYSRSQDLFKKEGLTDYDRYQQVALQNTQQAGATAPGPEVVAQVIFKAASDGSWKLRYPVGNNAPLFLFLRRIIPLSWFKGIVRMVVEKGF